MLIQKMICHIFPLMLTMGLISCQATKFQEINSCVPLHQGQSKHVEVIARTYWNNTGITLEKGHTYRFDIAGTWTDWTYQANAAGPICPVSNAIMFPFRPLLRYSPFRDCHANYFQAIGTIGRGEGKKLPQHAFIIRDGMPYTAPATGTLQVFANDAPWEAAYSNNLGLLDLTVSEL